MDYSDDTRRSMKDALSEEARRFLSPESTPTPHPGASSPPSSVPEEPASNVENPPSADPHLNPMTRKPSLSVVVPAIVSMTFRLPASLAGRLVGVATERKLQRERPFTQQDIVSEALRQWFARNGYGNHDGR